MRSEPTTATADRRDLWVRFVTQHPRCDGPCQRRSVPLHLFRTRDGRGLVQCCSASCAATATEGNTR